MPLFHRPRPRLRIDRGYVWGFSGQAFASATSLGLTLIAGRVLGPSGLGVVAIGFSGYLLVVSMQRSLVATPLVTETAALPVAARARSTSSGLAMVILLALAATVIFVAVSVIVGGSIGRGLLIFACWLLPAQLHDYWRTVLFRENRSHLAALNDGAWLVTMVAASVVALAVRNEWSVAAAWGLGAVCGATLGAVQLRIRPNGMRTAVTWWREKAASLGRWLVVQDGITYIAGYVMVVVLIKIVGTSAVGGLRAAQTLFAPYSLIAPAIGLAGLPAMARAVTRSTAPGRRLAWKLSGASMLLAVLYVATMLVVGGTLLRVFFGDRFTGYDNLVLPLGVWQIVAAPILGFVIFLKAERRGSGLVLSTVLDTLVSVTLVSIFATWYGLEGAAWGYAPGSLAAVITVAFLVAGRRSRREARTAAAGATGWPGSTP